MTYSKQMQKIVAEYRMSGEPWPAGTRTMAAWAIRTGRWELPESAAISKCAEDLQSAMSAWAAGTLKPMRSIVAAATTCQKR